MGLRAAITEQGERGRDDRERERVSYTERVSKRVTETETQRLKRDREGKRQRETNRERRDRKRRGQRHGDGQRRRDGPYCVC